MKTLLSLLLLPLLTCQCSTMQRAGDGLGAMARPVGTGAKKLASGAKSLAGGATKLWPWGKKKDEDVPAAAPQPAATPPEKPLEPAWKFPSSGLMVSDAELGPAPTVFEDSSVNLTEGWSLAGKKIAYRLDPGAAGPAALRVTGGASGKNGTMSAAADEFHYHNTTGVLALRGNASLSGAATSVRGTSAGTIIKIHLPTGAVSVSGPARWGN